jgi:hypothetical protein
MARYDKRHRAFARTSAYDLVSPVGRL